MDQLSHRSEGSGTRRGSGYWRGEAGASGGFFWGGCGKRGSGAFPSPWPAVTLAENGLPWLPGLNPSLRPLLELASAGDGSRLRTFLAVGSVPDHFFPHVIMLISSHGFGNNFQSHCMCCCNLHPYPHLILHFVNN